MPRSYQKRAKPGNFAENGASAADADFGANQLRVHTAALFCGLPATTHGSGLHRGSAGTGLGSHEGQTQLALAGAGFREAHWAHPRAQGRRKCRGLGHERIGPNDA